MAIEIRVTKEIGNYKPRLIGPFTMRQVICLLVGVPVCVFIYQTTSKFLPSDIPGFLCFIPGGIAWLFGWYEPYGMPTERFIQSIAVNILMAPSNRPFKIKNTHEALIQAANELEEKEAAEKQGKDAKKKPAKKAEKKEKRFRFTRSKDTTPEFYL